jgi:hypothetical protein
LPNLEDGFQYVLPDVLHTMDLDVAAKNSNWSDAAECVLPTEDHSHDAESVLPVGLMMQNWVSSLPHVPGSMDAIPEYDHLQRHQ